MKHLEDWRCEAKYIFYNSAGSADPVIENSFFWSPWMLSQINFHEILAERKSFISDKKFMERFFLSHLKGPAEEDIWFMFLVFYRAQCL